MPGLLWVEMKHLNKPRTSVNANSNQSAPPDPPPGKPGETVVQAVVPTLKTPGTYLIGLFQKL